MRIDTGSLAFNIKVLNRTGNATPAWGTAIVYQNEENKIKDDVDIKDIITGMVYKKIDCTSHDLSLPIGKGAKDYCGDADYSSAPSIPHLAAMFDKTYVNGVLIDLPFILLIMKDRIGKHVGRLQLKYSPKIKFGDHSNETFFSEVYNKLNIDPDAPIVYYDIHIENQDSLHFRCATNKKSMIFNSETEYKDFINDAISNDKYINHHQYDFPNDNNLQQIFYGAPGTGKSHKVKEITDKYEGTIRTTFHPDSDYSTFVGAYKPIMETRDKYGLNQKETVRLKDENGKALTEEVITYNFVPQAFIKAYLNAWKLIDEANKSGEMPKPIYLVIEEINRGNCAQIFGDLFQLLDRSRNGFSSYAIVPDSDIQKFIKEDSELGFGKGITVPDVLDDNGKTIVTGEEIRNGNKLVLPCNLYIWGTMNTSDQSLFPIDSAFKRRWAWKYIKISDAGKDWQIDINGTYYDWYKFIEQINKVISNMTSSADKQLGYFFCKAGKEDTDAEPTIITAETFVGKVLFYLWNDVFKDYGFDNSELFKYNKIYDGKSEVRDLTFPDFYNDNNEVDVDTVKQFVDNILKWNSNENK